MPLFDWKCEECGHEFEAVTRSEERRRPCNRCLLDSRKRGMNDSAVRQFTPTANIQVPAHFREDRGWHLPSRDDPAWEGMTKEGHGRARESDRPSLESEFRKAGLL